MKKVLVLIISLAFVFVSLAGCGTSEKDKALSTIEKFIEAVESGDTDCYIGCLDPDMQTLIKEGTNTIGNMFGVSNAYGMGSAASSLLSQALSETSGMSISFEQKEILSTKISDDTASFYIVYTISVQFDKSEEKVEQDITLEFKLNKKDGKWYIVSFGALDENVNTEILTEGYNISYATNFSDGVAFIQYKNENDEHKSVAIDTTGKVLFELDDGFSIDKIDGYQNGIMVVDNFFYDKTGTVIASPEISGYDELLTGNCYGYVLARKKEESFSGDKYYLGVLNNKGKWEHPLSSDNPIVKEFEKEGCDVGELNVGSLDYVGDTILEVDIGYFVQRYYNVVENKMTNGYIYYESRYYSGEPQGIYQYTLDGGKTLIVPNVTSSSLYDDMFIGSPTTGDENSYEVDESKTYLYDYTGKIIMDLSKYKNINAGSAINHGQVNGKEKLNYVNEHLLATVDNGTGGKYLALIKKDGTTAFEPIKMESGDDYYPLDKNGFVYKSDNEGTYTFYDYSGQTTEYKDISEFYGFHDGLALVSNTARQYYYIDIDGNIVIK